MAIRSDVFRAQAAGVPIFPDPPSKRLFELADIVQPISAPEFKMLPPNLNNAQCVTNAIRSSGVNPFKVPIVVDIGASAKFSTYRIGEIPTITRSRGSAKNGYWCTTKGGCLSTRELGALQGIPRQLIDDFKGELNKSDGVIGARIGNSSG